MIGKILNTFGAKLFAAITNLLIAIIISQMLGPMGKGQQGLIIASIAYILVFSNLIGGAAIIYLVPRFSYSLILIPAYIWSIFIGSLSFIILKSTNLLADPFIFAVCILSVVNAFIGINSSILIGKQKIKSANFISILQPIFIIFILTVSFFILKNKNIDTYLNALYFSFGLSFIVSVFLIKKHAEAFIFHPIKKYFTIIQQLIRYGLLNQLAHIFQMLSFRMSYYWLFDLFSESEVGIYSNGVALIESVWLISRSICTVQYSSIANSSDKVYSQKLSLSLTKGGVIFSLLIIIPLLFLPPTFYQFIFGAEFGEIGNVIRSLAPGILFFNIALILGHYFSGIGKYHVSAIASFIGMIVALFLFSLLIPIYGLVGAGLASSISYTITSLVIIIFFYRESKLGFNSLKISKTELLFFFTEVKNSLSNKVKK